MLFVRWNQVLPVIKGVAELFRDSDQLRRTSRAGARLKFSFSYAMGGRPNDFQTELERRIGFQLDPAVPEHPPADVYRDHIGHPCAKSKPGPLLRGRNSTPWKDHSGNKWMRPADLAERFAKRRIAHHQHAEPADRQTSPDCRRTSWPKS